MSKFEIGDRVEYVVDGVVKDTGTITRVFEGECGGSAQWWYKGHPAWWAKWDSDSAECHFGENELCFRKVEVKTPDIEDAGWFENTTTTNRRPHFIFEFLMSDGSTRHGDQNAVIGQDWNINKQDDGYPYVIKFRLIGVAE